MCFGTLFGVRIDHEGKNITYVPKILPRRTTPREHMTARSHNREGMIHIILLGRARSEDQALVVSL